MYFYCKHCRVCSSSFEWTQKSHPLVKSSIPCYRVGLNEIFCTGVWNSPVRTIARTQNVLWFINKYILHSPSLLMSESFQPLSVLVRCDRHSLRPPSTLTALSIFYCLCINFIGLGPCENVHLAWPTYNSCQPPPSLICGPKTETTGPQIRIPPSPHLTYMQKRQYAVCSGVVHTC